MDTSGIGATAADYFYLENPEIIKALRAANNLIVTSKPQSFQSDQQQQSDQPDLAAAGNTKKSLQSTKNSQQDKQEPGKKNRKFQFTSPHLKSELLKRIKLLMQEQCQTIVYVRAMTDNKYEISSFFDLSQRLSDAQEILSSATDDQQQQQTSKGRADYEAALVESINLGPMPTRDLSAYNHSRNIVMTSTVASTATDSGAAPNQASSNTASAGSGAGAQTTSSKNFAVIIDDSTDLSVKQFKTSKLFSLNEYTMKTPITLTLQDSHTYKQLVFFDFPISRK